MLELNQEQRLLKQKEGIRKRCKVVMIENVINNLKMIIYGFLFSFIIWTIIFLILTVNNI